ncbi:hypothetical protein LZ31DRAFT_561561 [Colletotrichum somersetense]|nr:hypothetical protein LZ31DRAFT_561561 [Colletotrichum somersetense]
MARRILGGESRRSQTRRSGSIACAVLVALLGASHERAGSDPAGGIDALVVILLSGGKRHACHATPSTPMNRVLRCQGVVAVMEHRGVMCAK